MLAKHWLEGKATGVKELDTYLKDTLGRKKTQNTSQGIGSRQVAEFLAKHWLESKSSSVKELDTLSGKQRNIFLLQL